MGKEKKQVPCLAQQEAGNFESPNQANPHQSGYEKWPQAFCCRFKLQQKQYLSSHSMVYMPIELVNTNRTVRALQEVPCRCVSIIGFKTSSSHSLEESKP